MIFHIIVYVAFYLAAGLALMVGIGMRFRYLRTGDPMYRKLSVLSFALFSGVLGLAVVYYTAFN